eukprot:NODE_502_length_7546_cov_0.138982.p5 type:complete len:161 gc:universal NODE_502_length_7546_cov_0.138982:3958-3476(-)
MASIANAYKIHSPFEHVSTVIWQKAEYCPQISATDVINRRVESGKLYTTRLLTMQFKLPKLLHFLTKDIHTHALEISVLDPITMELQQKSVNVSLSDWFMCTEQIKYSKNGEATSFESNADVTLSRSLRRMREHFIAEFSRNAEKGKLALEKALAAAQII